MMVIFKLFLIALLACVLEGKREERQSERKDVEKASQQLLGSLKASEDSPVVKSVKGDRNKGDSLKRDLLRKIFGDLNSGDGVSFEKDSPVLTCIIGCVNDQQKTHEGKNGEEGSEKSVSSDNKTAEQGEGKQLLAAQ